MQNNSLNILILDDETRITEKLKYHLEKRTYKVWTANDPRQAFNILCDQDIEILLLDVMLPGINGLDFLEQVKERFTDVEVIMISGFGDMDMVIKAMRGGAADFIRKPFQVMDIQLAIERTGKYLKLQQRLKSVEDQHSLVSKELEGMIEKEFIGQSKSIKRVLDMAMKTAHDGDVNVLITGENGTGKEIIARLIHYASPRKKQVFAPVNASAIPESLLESEFFGHVKGAFTDARNDKKGYFELASNGTLFLDEIADMPLALQAKLLRSIEENQIRKVGGDKEIPVNVRIISATNKVIEKLIEQDQFRLDLYHRINTIIIEIPPLRERTEDIEPLLLHFLSSFAKHKKRPTPIIAEGTIEKLQQYAFPGNVRELRNLVERAMILASNNTIGPDDFPLKTQSSIPVTNTYSYNLEEHEQTLIKAALEKVNYNQTKAADLLGISRDALKRKIKKFGIIIRKEVG